jgi:hypothetical protein
MTTDIVPASPLPADSSPEPGVPTPQMQRRAALLAAAEKLGITAITIDYDGEGDEGQIGDIIADRHPRLADGSVDRSVTAEQPDLHATPSVTTPDGLSFDHLHELADHVAWDILELEHAGFEDNDGGFGTTTILVPEHKITLEKSDRFVDFTTDTVEVL